MVPWDTTQTVPEDPEDEVCYVFGTDSCVAVCVIIDTITSEGKISRILRVGSSTPGSKLLKIVACACNYEPGSLVLTLLTDPHPVVINDHPSSTIEAIGLKCDGTSQNHLLVQLVQLAENKVSGNPGDNTAMERNPTPGWFKPAKSGKATFSVRNEEHRVSYSETKTQERRTVTTTLVEEKREIRRRDFRDEVYNSSFSKTRSEEIFDKMAPRRLCGPQMQDEVIDAYHAYQASLCRLQGGESGSINFPPLKKVGSGESEWCSSLREDDRDVVPELVSEDTAVSGEGDVVVPELTREDNSDVPELIREEDVGESESVVVDNHAIVPAPVRAGGATRPEPEVTGPPQREQCEQNWCVPANSPPENPEPQEIAYVGLVNQAMTCYLNSLLQTLFMTPEFRNALYRWEFDSREEGAVKNLPFQLQKLFLQLQVSKKSAIGTTELTTSFGWDSSEAWQQHDVQELCRVMFDALEQRFKNTDQADLISRLYEGKMKDYVRCLECGHESAREDTFLDVPLVVRPFGSNRTYGSVEEALQAFVAPETLDGSNQYFCERCDKKCDAHKGLKFLKFPYLLTLQLKRFDFDPNTMHRIKLNEKVTFPEVLNLNEFVDAETELTHQEKLDDADSGSGFDDDPGLKASSTVSSDDVGDMVDVDEGIDLVSNGNHELAADDKITEVKAPGLFEYELFSIMVHSGSANGGHYFAHIKSFTDGQWYCFNDVQVTKITYDDIRKTYGGGHTRGNYSSAYSSSANAYMLMYRQIDKHRNAKPMQPTDFPHHLQKVLLDVEEVEKKEQEKLDLEKAMCKFKLFCFHPFHKALVERKLVVHKDCTLADVTGTAYELLSLNGVVPYDCCRLVKYDSYFDSIDISLEDAEGMTVSEILDLAKSMSPKSSSKFDILLDIRSPDEEFVSYKPGGTTIKVFVVDLESEEMSTPLTIRSSLTSTVEELKQQISKKLALASTGMRLVFKKYDHELLLLSSPEKKLECEGFYRTDKVFMEYKDSEDGLLPFTESKLYRLLDRLEHTMSIYITMPNVDRESLESLAVTANGDFMIKNDRILEAETDLENRDAIEKQLNFDRGCLGAIVVQDGRDVEKETFDPASSGYQGSKTMNSDHSENSSLSSLTDSERTLVGDEMSPRNNSPVLDSRDEVKWDDIPSSSLPVYNESNDWDNDQSRSYSATGAANSASSVKTPEAKRYVYFRAVPSKDTEVLQAYMDRRMTIGDLKKQLEPHVGVTADYFKLYRVYANNQEFECTRLLDNLMSWSDDSKLTVKLGRALQKGEYRVKVYNLSVNSVKPCNHLVDMVFYKGMTVLQAKAIIAEIFSDLKIPPNRCRLRKKNWKHPGTIFFDHQKFEDDIPIFPNWEVFVELLEETEQVTNPSQLSLYLKVWHPAKLSLSDFTEVILNEKTIDELLRKSSEVSGIPIENLEFAKGQGTFPCEMDRRTMHTEMEWHSNANSLSGWPLYISEDGSVLCCRDKTEELRELSEEEKKELSTTENSRFTKASAKTIYSPQKEKALKIYTDSPPASASSLVPAVPVDWIAKKKKHSF